MHIYIDETGDTGFKFDRGSSNILAITLIIFKNTVEIERSVESIRRLERRKKFPDDFEWHFTKTNRSLRIEFLQQIKDRNFTIRTVIMNKRKITGPNLKNSSDILYNYTCKLVFQYMSKSLKEAKIIFDKKGPRKFYTHLKKYLREKCELDHKKIKKISSKDSKKSKPLQIVDMIAGAIGRSYSDKSDKNDYFNIIRHKIVDQFTFPDDLRK